MRTGAVPLLYYSFSRYLAPLGWYNTAILARWLIGRMSVATGTRGARFVR